MSIVIRCNKCRMFYATKNDKCIVCGHKERTKSYHVRLGNNFTFAGNSLTAAKEVEVRLKSEKRLCRIPEYKQTKDILFSDFIKKYYEPHYSGKKSALKMRFFVSYFTKVFKDKPLRTITPADIEQAVTEKTSKLTPRTRDHYLAIIRRIFNYAVELELLERTPVKMKELKVDNARHRYLTDKEAGRLLEECGKSKSKHLLPMVMIALHTGMRLGEIKSLKNSDIVDGKFYLKSTHTKNSRVKIIPLNATLRTYLEEYLAIHGDFHFNKECRGSYNSAVAQAGIKDFRFHDLRHTFASKLKAKNINDTVIQKLMGLETPSMVQRYAHLSPESVLNAIEAVEYV